MADKRITELTNERLTLGDGDFTIVDSESGTYKYDLNRLAKKTITDTTLSVEGKPADAKAVGDALASVDVDTVNNARQLLSESYLLDEEPYLFRASGGDGSDRVEECIVGGSVAWNQLVQNGDFADTSVWNTQYLSDFSIASNEATLTFNDADISILGQPINIVSGHRYFCSVFIKGDATYNTVDCMIGTNPVHNYAITTSYVNEQFIFSTNTNGANFNVVRDNESSGQKIYLKNVQLIDLTAMFGSTIADYIYSLEQATAGAGVAWFKKYFPEDYYPYSAPTLKHVEGVSAKQIRDSDDNVTAIYPLDSSLTLRGIPKLTDGKMWFDGDKYNADGSVTRNTILRAYQSGDESLANAITDGTNTVVYSANASTETATPYTALQTLDPYGTEEFVTTGIVPVGHYSKYLENLRSKIEGLPKDFSTLIAPTEKAYKATQNYTVGSLLIVDNILYKVTSAIANGGTITPNTNVTATTLAAVIAAL